MKANQCKHFKLGRCGAPDAPSKACVLMDRRVKACGWFVLERRAPAPLSLTDYQEWAERRRLDRSKSGRRRTENELVIPRLKDFK